LRQSNKKIHLSKETNSKVTQSRWRNQGKKYINCNAAAQEGEKDIVKECKRMLGGLDSSGWVIGIDREGHWGYALERLSGDMWEF
jgi:hypothetical protein